MKVRKAYEGGRFYLLINSEIVDSGDYQGMMKRVFDNYSGWEKGVLKHFVTGRETFTSWIRVQEKSFRKSLIGRVQLIDSKTGEVLEEANNSRYLEAV